MPGCSSKDELPEDEDVPKPKVTGAVSASLLVPHRPPCLISKPVPLDRAGSICSGMLRVTKDEDVPLAEVALWGVVSLPAPTITPFSAH